MKSIISQQGLVGVPLALFLGFGFVSCLEGSGSFSNTPLPMAGCEGFMGCGEAAEAPQVEVWAGAADSVLIGTVTRIYPHIEPAVVMINDADPPYVSAADCDGIIEGGMQITLSNVEVIMGLDLGKELTVTLGTNKRRALYPKPSFLTGGSIQWQPADEEGRFKIGQRIGAAMHVDPDFGFIGPKRGTFFQVFSDGTIQFQNFCNERCYQPAPLGLNGLSLDALKNLLSSLDLSDPAIMQEIEFYRRWNDNLTARLKTFWGALCSPWNWPDCDNDDDCVDDQICQDGFCGDECKSDSGCGPAHLCVDGKCV